MNPWKLATFGMVAVLVTALGTGLGTAWMLRPSGPAPAAAAATAPQAGSVVSADLVTPRPVRAVSGEARTVPGVRRVATTAAPAACDSGDRVWRIAKPGGLGGLLGAGLGAAGGAIANGGKSAGKGALIGGLAGAALGSAYGAYQTKAECGTVFGRSAGSNLAPVARDGGLTRAVMPAASGEGGGITVYDAGRPRS